MDATDWAIEGTVTWARREEGRPALAGTAAGAATGTTAGATNFDLDEGEEATVDIGTGLAAALADCLLTGIGAALTDALPPALAVDLATAFASTLDDGFGAGFTTGLATTLATDLVTGLEGGLDAGLGTGLLGFAATTGLLVALGGACLTTFTGAFPAVLTAFFAATFTPALRPVLAAFLGTTLAAGLAGVFTALADGCGAALAFALAGGVTAFLAVTVDLALPVCVFTSSLLAGLACACSGGTALPLRTCVGLSARVCSARECTGLACGKPISCKSETIIGLPNLVLFNI